VVAALRKQLLEQYGVRVTEGTVEEFLEDSHQSSLRDIYAQILEVDFSKQKVVRVRCHVLCCYVCSVTCARLGSPTSPLTFPANLPPPCVIHTINMYIIIQFLCV
jgi:hypothetical protein